MQNMEYYNKEGLDKMQRQIDEADELMTGTIFKMQEGDFGTFLTDEAFGHGSARYAKSVERLKKLKARITALGSALSEVRNLHEQAEKNADSGMENIAGMGSIYGVGGFGAIFHGSLTSGADYSDSKAYYYENNGYHLTSDFNDLAAFQQSREYKNAMNWTAASEFGNEELYYQWLLGDGDSYTDGILEEALEDVLKQLPGYQEMDKNGVPELNWDAVGKAYGVTGLKEKMAFLNQILGEAKETGHIGKDVLPALYEWFRVSFKEVPGLAPFFEGWFEVAQERAIEANAGITAFSSALEYFELGSRIIYHMLSNHTQQVEYLNTVQEALLQAGYSHGNVIKKIAELKEIYADQEAYAWHEMEAYAVGKTYDKATSLFDLIPTLKEVKFTSKMVSSGAKALQGTEIKAVKKLMGYQQYDAVLSGTYEKYRKLMLEGVASKTDIEKADRIFELLKATKIQEYTHIMTISGEGSEWYKLAKEKLQELNAMEMYRTMDTMGDAAGDIFQAAVK